MQKKNNDLLSDTHKSLLDLLSSGDPLRTDSLCKTVFPNGYTQENARLLQREISGLNQHMREKGYRIIVQLGQRGRIGQPGVQYKWEKIPEDEQRLVVPPTVQQPNDPGTPWRYNADTMLANPVSLTGTKDTVRADTSPKAEERPDAIEAYALTSELAGTLALFILQEARQNSPEFYEGDDIIEACNYLVNRWFHDSFGYLPTIHNSFRAAKEELSSRSVVFESTDYEELLSKDPFLGDIVLWLNLQDHYSSITDKYLSKSVDQTPTPTNEEFLTDIYNQWNTQGRSFRPISSNPAQLPVTTAAQNEDISSKSTRVEKAIPQLREKIRASLDEIAQKNISNLVAGPQIQALFPRLAAPGRANSSDIKVAADKKYITPSSGYDGRGHAQYDISDIVFLLTWHDLRRQYPFMTVYTKNIQRIIKDEIAIRAEEQAASTSTTSSSNLTIGK